MMQVRQHGLWLTLRRAFLTGWQVNMDPQRQRRAGQQGRPAGAPAQSRSAPTQGLLHTHDSALTVACNALLLLLSQCERQEVPARIARPQITVSSELPGAAAS